MLTKVLALEWAPFGSPSTPSLDVHLHARTAERLDNPEYLKRVVDRIPIARWDRSRTSPRRALLASEAGRMVTARCSGRRGWTPVVLCFRARAVERPRPRCRSVQATSRDRPPSRQCPPRHPGPCEVTVAATSAVLAETRGHGSVRPCSEPEPLSPPSPQLRRHCGFGRPSADPLPPDPAAPLPPVLPFLRHRQDRVAGCQLAFLKVTCSATRALPRWRRHRHPAARRAAAATIPQLHHWHPCTYRRSPSGPEPPPPPPCRVAGNAGLAFAGVKPTR